ncbi:hypothetical protein [Alkalicoccobacillus porphyridii]|uniref:Uncharacterized protein n=1 Tax=Alkalicoccobacillus porphyridii TaxID=2597270 RepID=A0A553ZVT9_9BACI|nr:hypothetical protein [Alkalicoccobacillus porphyridii]TSB45589.1 hypothetical protein FN960_15580 [Alkalicoccobacillus porphyridii]
MMGLLPSKKERMENQKKYKERNHWSGFVIIFSGIWMYSLQIMNTENTSSYVYFVIPGFILIFIPLLSAYRHRESHVKKRRLLAKDLSEIYFMFSAIILGIFLFSLFNTSMANVAVRGILAGITSILYLSGGLYLRNLYAHLVAIQNIDPSEDRIPHNKKRTLLFVTLIVAIIIIIIFFNWIMVG